MPVSALAFYTCSSVEIVHLESLVAGEWCFYMIKKKTKKTIVYV